MKKWIISALAYLTIVVLAYIAYDSFANLEGKQAHSEEHKAADSKTEDHDTHGELKSEKSNELHKHESEVSSDNEINVDVQESNKDIIITLEDLAGHSVDDLEINHEKLLHLIVVDEHLDQYYHLHPEEITSGQFTVKSPLKEGNYKAFVDINSKSLSYEVKPVPFKVGKPSTNEHNHASLEIDKKLEKIINENKVTLTTTDLVVGEPVTLTFDVHGAELEPYLGAMGHVVILDEKAEEYLHVHPPNVNEPVFQTEFSHAGIYKLWAEFQVNGRVTAYPFVVEVK
ncbi:hypothetical protein [Metabacillus litoralis]|uniref:hypothetical protein n=1 Tax=Metabacillus litoralis TaxID=152268 RepID=UPI001CFCBA9B|nr:hypothetical protein [Metabacillus litoralis]